MRESRLYGFVRGALSNERPYRVISVTSGFGPKRTGVAPTPHENEKITQIDCYRSRYDPAHHYAELGPKHSAARGLLPTARAL